jgi:hypothetical protein
VDTTGNHSAFITSLIKLAELNYTPRTIRKIFELTLTHPSIERRIEVIEGFISGSPKALKFRRMLPEVKLALAVAVAALGILLAFGGPAFESDADIHYMRGAQFQREKMWEESLKE